MKITTNGKWLLVVAIAMLCFAPCALAQCTQGCEFDWTGGLGPGGWYGSYYIGAIQVQEGGASGPVFMVADDDWQTSIYPGQTWYANANYYTDLSNVTYSGSSAATNYAAALSLASALLFGNAAAESIAGGNLALLNFAIYAIFDPGDVQSFVNSSTVWNTIQQLIIWAETSQGQGGGALTSAQLEQWIIWTPVNCAGQQGNCNGNEMLQYVPEGGAALLYLLLAGVSCFGAMFFRSRNRHATPRMA